MTVIEAPRTGRVVAGAAIRRLARLAAHLTADERNDEPLIVALRLGLDQLFRGESESRRTYLRVAADGLGILRAQRRLDDADLAVIDLVRAASLVRAGETARARAALDEQRRRRLPPDLERVLEDIESELAQ